MSPFLFQLGQEELEYDGALNTFSQPYLQLLRVLESRDKWSRESCLPRMQQFNACSSKRLGVEFQQLLILFWLAATLIDKLLIETTYPQADGLASITRVSAGYMGFFYLHRLIFGLSKWRFQTSYSVQLVILGGITLASTLLYCIVNSFQGKHLGFAFMIVSGLWTCYNFLEHKYQHWAVTGLRYLILVAGCAADKCLVVYVAVSNGAQLSACLWNNVVVQVTTVLLMMGWIAIRYLFSVDENGLIVELQQLLNSESKEETVECSIQDNPNNSWVWMELISYLAALGLYGASAYLSLNQIWAKNYTTAFYYSVMAIYPTALLLLCALQKAIVQASSTSPTTRLLNYLFALPMVAPSLVLMFIGPSVVGGQLAQICIRASLFVPLCEGFKSVDMIACCRQGITRVFWLINGVILPCSAAIIYGIITNNTWILLGFAVWYGASTIAWELYPLYLQISNAVLYSKSGTKTTMWYVLQVVGGMRDSMARSSTVSCCFIIICLSTLSGSYLSAYTSQTYTLFLLEGYLLLLLFANDLSSGYPRVSRVLMHILSVGGQTAIIVFVSRASLSINVAYPFIIAFLAGSIVFEVAKYFTKQEYLVFCKLTFLFVMHWMIFVPFFLVLPIGILIMASPYDFYYYYILGSFMMISIAITAIGILVHIVLNLSRNTLRSLVVLSRMEEWMRSKLIVINPDKILAIWQVFEDFSYSSEGLMNFLKEEKATKIKVLDDQECQDDYELIDPPIHQPKKVIKRKSKTELTMEPGSEHQKIQPDSTGASPYVLRADRIGTVLLPYSNASAIQRISPRQLSEPAIRKMTNSIEYHKFMRSYEVAGLYLCRLFYLFCEPNIMLDNGQYRVMACLLNFRDDGDIANYFRKHSAEGRMGIIHFRNVIFDQAEIDPTNPDTSVLLQWIRNNAFPLFYQQSEEINYLMFRRVVQLEQQATLFSREAAMGEADKRRLLLLRERSKKAGLLEIRVSQPTEEEEPITTLDKKQAAPVVNMDQTTKDIKQSKKKTKEFESSLSIYGGIVHKCVDISDELKSLEKEEVPLRSFSCSLGNIICIITKLMDFALTFLWNPIMTFYEYYQATDLSSIKPAVFLLAKQYIYAIIIAAALGYVVLLLYHRQQFVDGSLGLDEFKQSLSFASFKFYTTRMLFVLGSSLTGLILNNSVSMFLCSSVGNGYVAIADGTLECLSLTHVSYMIASLVVVLIYYPLAVVVFPYSSIIDRSKQIKYRAEFEVAYVQLKLFVGAFLTLLSLKMEQVKLEIVNISTAVFCLFLFALFHRLQPCSVASINRVEKPAYLLCVWVALAATLCEYVTLWVCIGMACLGVAGYLLYVLVTYCKKDGVADNEQLSKHIQDVVKAKQLKVGNPLNDSEALKRQTKRNATPLEITKHVEFESDQISSYEQTAVGLDQPVQF